MSNQTLPELGSEVMQDIYRCAIQRYPNEACGFLVRTQGEKYRFMEAMNVSETPREDFVMRASDIIAAEDAGEVIAIWHSHVERSAEASDPDRSGCEATELPWMILAIRKNVESDMPFHFSEMNVIYPCGFEMPYLGRPYVFGVFDCWMLCRDYLKREFDVELNANAHLHIPSWYTGDNDILDQNYRNEGLVRMAPGTEPPARRHLLHPVRENARSLRGIHRRRHDHASPDRPSQLSGLLRWDVSEAHDASPASQGFTQGRRDVSELVHVQLGGAMAKNFGRHWKLKVRNTKQAIDLIEANRPGFKAWIKRNRNHFDKYHIQVTNKQGHKWSMDDTEYQMMGESENIAKIRITPVPRGSGGKAFGWFQTFVGAAMIAVGALASGLTFGASSALVMGGMSLMMGGVSMLISPQASNASVRQADNTDSFYFDGPQNTSNQGNPVQLNYGEEILVGSQIVSSSITIDQL